MKDKWILVTGSSSGIGNAITIKLLDLGAKVVGIARDHKKFIIQNNNYTSYINNNNIILIHEINQLQFNITKKEYKKLYNNVIKMMKDFLQNNK